MPLTAMGPYEAAITSDINGETHEYAVQSFFFLPIPKLIALALVLAAGVALAFRPWRFIKAGRTWWLAAPPIVGLLSYLAGPCLGFLGDFLPPLLMGQMAALSLALWIVCRFRTRRRTVAALVTVGLNPVVLVVCMAMSSGMGGMTLSFILPALILSLLWTLPSLLAFTAVRKRFTALRLAIGLLIGWLLTASGVLLFGWAAMDMPLETQAVLPLVLIPLGYLIGLFLLATRNQWCRSGLQRALGLSA